jgi:F0F1-type ATP synthase assembly protein I
MTETTTETTLYCVNHRTVETLLRCNKCERPICMKCAQSTPVGYRCKDCVYQQQNKYYNAENWDNPIALGVSLVVTTVATPFVGIFLSFFGFWGLFLAFMVGSGAGGLLAQIIRQAVGRRRGRYLRYFALAGVVLGVVLGSIIALLVTGRFPLFNPVVLIFAFLAITTTYQILK